MILELLQLAWIFFKIGLFTFGGGYAMIPLMESELVSRGLIDVNMLYDFIGIAESTPGPIAINMATFIGNEAMVQYGFLARIFGSIVMTTAVALPSFIVILLIATLGSKFLESKFVQEAFKGLKPTVIGLILSVSFGLIVRLVFPMISFENLLFDFSIFQFRNLVILIILVLLTVFYKKLSPITLILVGAMLSMIVYSVWS
ncbi:MAG TPA: chromate transporter [Acholeplasmataceae bacterium]|nr:chromate transporter [Acholeplasmataceae bacterium]